MSRAFVRESEEQWLHDVGPSLSALQIYLTRENNGIGFMKKAASSAGNTTAKIPDE